MLLRNVVKTYYVIYLFIRIAEAGHLGLTAYAWIHSVDVAVSMVFCFLFGLAVVFAGVARLGVRVALIWHIILEALWLPCSFDFAWHTTVLAASATSPLGSLSTIHRFIVMSAVNITVQGLFAIAGLHVVRWMAVDSAARKTVAALATSTKSQVSSLEPDVKANIPPQSVHQSQGRLKAASNKRKHRA